MLTHGMLWNILIEAEERVNDKTLPQEARDRSQETVSLCKERMAKEGLSREKLKELAAQGY